MRGDLVSYRLGERVGFAVSLDPRRSDPPVR
jgi:hypothetical protein